MTQFVLSESECSIYVKKDINQKYCTGYPGTPVDTCQVRIKFFYSIVIFVYFKGDSGTGMMCEKDDGKWYVSGIVSYGLGNCNHISVNARVDFFSKWIDNVINTN